MKIITSAFAALLLAATLGFAQSGTGTLPATDVTINSTAVLGFADGIRIDSRTVGSAAGFSDAPNAQVRYGTWNTWDGPVIHHFFFINQRYFGYDLEAARIGGTDAVQLKFEPLSVDWTGEGMKLPAPGPSLPPPQTVSDGGAIAMDLAVNPKTGEKITEQFVVHLASPTPPIEAHDLTLDDVAMRLAQPVLFADGQELGRSAMSYTAPIFAFRLAQGSWIYLSSKPHDGYRFEKAGVLYSSRAEFVLGGHHYDLRSRSPILLTSQRTINLYAFVDAREPASRGNIWQVLPPGAALVKDRMEVRAGTVQQILPKF